MKKLTIFLLCLVAFSCSSVKRIENKGQPSIYITDDKKYTILDLGLLDKDIEIHQLISGSYKNSDYQMQAYFIANNDEMSLSVFTLLWNTIYELKYNDLAITHQGIAGFNDSDPYYIVADLQFCYYPIAPLELMLNNAGINLDVQINDEGWIRQFYSDGDLIIEIKRTENILEYNNYLREYSYRIEEISN